MRCPICKKPVTLHDPYVPFCSERCRLIDLGHWASGDYVISTPVVSPQREESEWEKGETDG